MTQIDAATLEAYRQTHYRVGADGMVLRVGEPSEALARLHRLHHVDCSAFITACNPRGELLGPQVNARRQQALLAALVQQGHTAIAGTGEHPGGGWPGEPSYLVPGLERTAALHLAGQFEQNALLWSGADAVPQLILLR